MGMQRNEAILARARELYHARRAPEAVALLAALLAKEPQNPNVLVQYALYLRAVGKFEESAEALRTVPRDMPGWHMLTGWHELRKGNFLHGMSVWEKECGIYRAEDRFPFPKEKRLMPDSPVSGKRVLLVLEGGVGDEIAYVRFAQTLFARGARVRVAASPEILPIIERAQAVEEVWPLEAISHDQYDYYLPSFNAIATLGVEHPSYDIAFPYISANAEQKASWTSWITLAAEGRLKIGVQWHGNLQFDHVEFKSIPSETLVPLSTVGKVFSLQRDATPEQLLQLDAFNTQVEPPSWQHTLACIAHMDVIVCGDTTIAHMAGALGKKVLLLLPHAPHAYWVGSKETALWYPSIQIIRQPNYNDWEGAIQKALALL